MTQESLTSPSQNTRQDKGSSYSILTGHLSRFNELGLLPRSFLLSRLHEGRGVEAALSANNARYHKTCRQRYNKTKLDRAEKRHLKIAADEEKEVAARMQTRYLSGPSNTKTKHQEIKCFFCEEAPGSAGVHEVATFQLDSCVRLCALILNNMKLLTKLNAVDMIAQEAKYLRNCLLNLYNHAHKSKEMVGKSTDDEHAIEDLLLQSWWCLLKKL